MEKEEKLEQNGAPESENEQKPSEIEKMREELLYQKADLENMRKRLLKDHEVSLKFANERLIKDLLPTVDFLDRALQQGEKGSPLQQGILLTLKELETLLKKYGAELIGRVDEPFDPQRHEAISEVDSAEIPENTIVQVLQRGCLLHGRLLQPARVVVSKHKDVQES